MSREYGQTLAKWEDKNGHRMPRQTEQDILAKQAQEARLAKERAFKPRLDMAIDKMIRHRFYDLETAMRKDKRIEIIFERAKKINEEIVKKTFAETGEKSTIITAISDLNEREKHILISVLK